MDNQYHVAELRHQEDALDAIRQLENRLSKQNGSQIALVAYSAGEKKEQSGFDGSDNGSH
ncbi:hypothetical protein PAT3040_01373 [Paenibacillus agaridevorans]|uniref:Uncharacterized protein n=1 Tax=Paenibacillus agaridevorans TaxID=171404 RepID=A0A2R5ETW2_9BACL|nr:hypothetical protein [Paenibacillus agaridevorans]GBG06834.1 hypothetical protein PAT3040_01373 [Paenibacillus agaridevorans]